MTTKMDLLKDNLIDLLNNYQLVESNEQLYNVVERMLDAITDYDIEDLPATNMDFNIKVVNTTVGRKHDSN